MRKIRELFRLRNERGLTCVAPILQFDRETEVDDALVVSSVVCHQRTTGSDGDSGVGDLRRARHFRTEVIHGRSRLRRRSPGYAPTVLNQPDFVTADNGMLYLYGPTGLVMEFDRLGYNSRTLLFDPQGSFVSSSNGAYVPQGNGNMEGTSAFPVFYDAYGLPVWAPPAPISDTIPAPLNLATSQPFQYKGQYGYYTDGASGLIYCQHRYYDPITGRWTERDPIGLDGGTNVYEYCLDNPIKFIDLTGFQALDSVTANTNRLVAEAAENPTQSITELQEYLEQVPSKAGKDIVKNGIRKVFEQMNSTFTRGWAHSLKHAQEFFGRKALSPGDLEEWKSMIDGVTKSKKIFDSSLGSSRTIAFVGRFRNMNMVVHYFVDGERAGQLASAFRVNGQTAKALYEAAKMFGFQ